MFQQRELKEQLSNDAQPQLSSLKSQKQILESRIENYRSELERLFQERDELEFKLHQPIDPVQHEDLKSPLQDRLADAILQLQRLNSQISDWKSKVADVDLIGVAATW